MSTKRDCNGTGPDHDLGDLLLVSEIRTDMITPYEFELLLKNNGVKNYQVDDEDSMVEVVSKTGDFYQLYAYCGHDYKALKDTLHSWRKLSFLGIVD